MNGSHFSISLIFKQVLTIIILISFLFFFFEKVDFHLFVDKVTIPLTMNGYNLNK